MRTCTNCASQLAEDSDFCRHCGLSQAVASAGRKRNGRGGLAALGLFAALGVVAAGVVGYRFLTVTEEETFVGGAASPSAAVIELLEAVSNEDPLAAIGLMAPDEVDGVADIVDVFFKAFQVGGLDAMNSSGSFDLTVGAEGIDVDQEGENAAIISFELTGSIDVADDASFLGVAVPDIGDFDTDVFEQVLDSPGDEVEVVVVRLGGNWYVSPMLTAGHLVSENIDLAGGDFGSIGERRTGGGSDALDAVEQMVEAISDRDVDGLAEALGGGEGRFAEVFGEAIDELLGEVPRDVEFSVHAETEGLDDGRVRLDEVQIELSNDFSEVELAVSRDCLTVEENGGRDRFCLFDEFPLDFDVADPDEVILETELEDGGYRVRVVRSATTLASKIAGQFERTAVLYAAGLEWADTSLAAPVDAEVDVDFDGDWFKVFAFDLQPGTRYRSMSELDTEVYLRDADGRWRNRGSVFQTEDETEARIVVYSELSNCTDLGCFPDGRGSTTLSLKPSRTQDIPFPTIVPGTIQAGEELLFNVTVATAEDTAIELLAGGDVVYAFIDNDVEMIRDDTWALQPGTFRLAIVNMGDVASEFRLEPTNADN